ncbi:MAG: hypothetical protein JO321_10195 [Solirubrobacterales bacterium]|nr:hypothetical protein [Solirubrobacterales bacterium]MBV9166690.1 hypothetical protein [Solirubrobacterales bacterium]MBV9535767.1 hypothetical protein [Solirubrobacterales bacterium]
MRLLSCSTTISPDLGCRNRERAGRPDPLDAPKCIHQLTRRASRRHAWDLTGDVVQWNRTEVVC